MVNVGEAGQQGQPSLSSVSIRGETDHNNNLFSTELPLQFVLFLE
eukprot:SAG31_NODE_53_length_30139_cov_31.002197_19_plen_45_part_00